MRFDGTVVNTSAQTAIGRSGWQLLPQPKAAIASFVMFVELELAPPRNGPTIAAAMNGMERPVAIARTALVGLPPVTKPQLGATYGLVGSKFPASTTMFAVESFASGNVVPLKVF